MKGFVKWFDKKKGYGFITPDPNGKKQPKDVFVHFTCIQMEGFRELKENQRVEFGVSRGPKGEQAENVVILE